MIKALVTRFIINVVIREIFGRVFFGLLLGGVIAGCTYILWTHGYQEFIDPKIVLYLFVYFFSCGFLYDIFKIGKYLLRIGSFTVLFATPILLLARLFIHYKHMPFINLGLGFAIFIAYEFRHGIKFTKRINTFKTLREIDSLGNGDTYAKGKQFEEFVAELYRGMGYKAMTTGEMRAKGLLPAGIQKRGGSGEQGVDVHVYDHTTKENVIIQCKHYSGKVSNSAVQEIHGALALYGAQRAIVVTNQYFTEPAKELAFANKVALVDREGLLKMVEYVNNNKNKKSSVVQTLF